MIMMMLTHLVSGNGDDGGDGGSGNGLSSRLQ